MTAELLFEKSLKNFGYGLVRLGSNFKIIDKNLIAEEIGVFPKRGASILKLVEYGGRSLRSLSDRAGDNTVISLSNGIKSIEALAIREENGNVMLLLHPLICSFTLGKSGRMSSVYGLGLLKMIYGEKVERGLNVSEMFPHSPLSVKRLTLVTTTVSMIAEKLSKIALKSSITVNFEGIEQNLFAAVNFTSVIYAFSEILSLEGTFSDGKGSRITFKGNGDTFDIVLEGRVKKSAIGRDLIFIKIFKEALSLVDVNAEVRITDDGFIYAKASVKTEIATSYVREPGVIIEDAIFGYFDYSLKYYELTENTQ